MKWVVIAALLWGYLQYMQSFSQAIMNRITTYPQQIEQSRQQAERGQDVSVSLGAR